MYIVSRDTGSPDPLTRDRARRVSDNVLFQARHALYNSSGNSLIQKTSRWKSPRGEKSSVFSRETYQDAIHRTYDP